MRWLPLCLLLAALPVATAAAAGGEPQLAFTTLQDVVVATADGTSSFGLTGGRFGTPHDVVWSPDGLYLAFATNGRDGRQIVVESLDGSDVRVVAASPTDDLSSPTFSPDGARVAYLDAAPGGTDVWLVRAGGGPVTRLTTDGGRKTEVAWSPGGSRLLVVSGGLIPSSSISTIDLADGTTRKLVNGVTATWSPDGTRIAYLDPQFRLLVMNADGSGSRELAPRSDSPPRWSSDSSTIVFDRQTPIGPATKFGLPVRSDVLSVPADGSFPARQLTGPRSAVPAELGPDQGHGAVFSADDAQIYYERLQGSGDNATWRMNPDGTCRQPVPALTHVAAGPVWRPGTAFGAPAHCVDLRVYAVPQAEYFPTVGRAGAIVLVENDGDEPASNLRFTASASGAGAHGVRCVPRCTLDSLEPGGTASLLVDAATSSPGGVNVTVQVTADQTSVDHSGTTASTGLNVLSCSIVGTDGPDQLAGTSHADRICGKPGADWISGGAGDDYLDAGNGNDTVIGGPGHDTILGRGGRDTIFARDGRRDWIDCGTERDVAVVDRIDHVRGCERVLRR